MDRPGATARRTSTYKANLISGLAVHSVAALAFATGAAIRIGGCDRSDGLFAAIALAMAVDIVLAGVTLLIMRRSNHNDRSAALKGWALSSLPAVALLGAAMVYLTSVPSDCPV